MGRWVRLEVSFSDLYLEANIIDLARDFARGVRIYITCFDKSHPVIEMCTKCKYELLLLLI